MYDMNGVDENPSVEDMVESAHYGSVPSRTVYVVTDGTYNINDAVALTQKAADQIVKDVGGIKIVVTKKSASWNTSDVDGYEVDYESNNGVPRHYFVHYAGDALDDLRQDIYVSSSSKLVGFLDHLTHNGMAEIGGKYAVVGHTGHAGVDWNDISMLKHEMGHLFGLGEGGTMPWEHNGKVCVMNYWHAFFNTSAVFCSACEGKGKNTSAVGPVQHLFQYLLLPHVTAYIRLARARRSTEKCCYRATHTHALIPASSLRSLCNFRIEWVRTQAHPL